MQGSRVLAELLKCKGRIRVLEGGSRSSKTWSIIQFIILYCQTAAKNKQVKQITIARQKLTWLKLTILKDFKEIMMLYGLWNDNDFHKSEMTYTLFGCEILFGGLDEPQKLHGRKQHIFWYNEAIEASKEDFDQLLMRTEEFGILDYNPSTTKHWIFEKVLTRPDVDFIHSTLLDNPFLPELIRKEILSYEPTPENEANGTADENKWKIYGLGLRAQIEGLIFTNVGYVKEFPVVSKGGIGLDFGFTNDPTAIVRLGLAEGQVFAKELCYERGLTNSDICNRLEGAGVSKSELIVADSAEPKSIAEIRRMGWNIIGATKGHGSISNGIDILKRYRINITEDSVNFKKESENYTWKKDRATNQYLNIPIEAFNHCWDATRYIASETLSTQGETSRPRTMGRGWQTALQ